MAYDYPNSPVNGQTFTPPGGQTYTWDAAGTKWTVTGTGLTSLPPISTFYRNILINPDGRIAQRVTSVPVAGMIDSQYVLDRWYVLTQTAAVTVDIVGNAENGTPYMARLSQQQATAQRMGQAQIIESDNIKHLRGRQVTLSGRYRCSAAQPIRWAVLEWPGTANVVTADVVQTWTSSTYTNGAGAFFITTVNVLGVGSATPSAATLSDLTPLTVTLGSGCNNLYVFIWTEGTLVQNGTLDFALQLEEGTQSTVREKRPIGIEMELCQRYYEYLEPTNSVGWGWSGRTMISQSYTAWGSFRTRKMISPTISAAALNQSGFSAATGTMAASTYGLMEGRVASATQDNAFYQSSGAAIAEL